MTVTGKSKRGHEEDDQGENNDDYDDQKREKKKEQVPQALNEPLVVDLSEGKGRLRKSDAMGG